MIRKLWQEKLYVSGCRKLSNVYQMLTRPVSCRGGGIRLSRKIQVGSFRLSGLLQWKVKPATKTGRWNKADTYLQHCPHLLTLLFVEQYCNISCICWQTVQGSHYTPLLFLISRTWNCISVWLLVMASWPQVAKSWCLEMWHVFHNVMWNQCCQWRTWSASICCSAWDMLMVAVVATLFNKPLAQNILSVDKNPSSLKEYEYVIVQW